MICRSPHQNWSRALVKTFLYRVLTFAVTFGAAYYILNDPSIAFDIGVTLTVLKTILYLFYERLWDHITWGMGA